MQGKSPCAESISPVVSTPKINKSRKCRVVWEVELLVRQASVKVFLEEKLKRLAEEIEQRVISDTTLTDWLIEYEKSIEKVKEIDGQIASSNRADLIREVIGGLQPSDKKLFVEVLGVKVDVSPILRLSEGLVEGIAKSVLR